MQRQARNLLPQVQGVSILTRPPGRVQPVRAVGVAVREVVSILTRPEGRVQRHRDGEDDEIHARVSILTRPEGRVQPESGMYSARCSMFQSSPGQKAGCNQPERERRRGNECVSILTRPEGRVQPAKFFPAHPLYCFNPHPAFWPGATLDGLRVPR